MKEQNFLMLVSSSFLTIGLFNSWYVNKLSKKTNKTKDIIVEIKAQKTSCIICLVMAIVYSFRLIYLLTN